MDNTCASYCETPSVRCPNPHKPDSVFCDIHSLQHLANYVKYKKLEANLHEVRDGQSADYYLKLYAKISNAYRVRFNFREGAIAYSARDIGHQIRLDWLWTQCNLCVQHLETIFQAQSTEPQGQCHDIQRKQSVSQAERVQARKVFKTYTATKKRVEDYESLIKEAVNSDTEKVESLLKEYVSNIRKRFGEEAPTVEQLVRLGCFLSVYITVGRFNTQHEKRSEKGALGSCEARDTTEQLLFGKLAYLCMMGDPSWCLEMNSSVEDRDTVPDERLINHFKVLRHFISLIDLRQMIFFVSSEFLCTVYEHCMSAYVVSNSYRELIINEDGLLEMVFPPIRFTDDELSMFDYSQFIESNGNLEQLIAWRANSIHPSIVDENPRNKPHAAALITEYYMQALILKLSINDPMDPRKFSDTVRTIFSQLGALATHFSFAELVWLLQYYYDFGRCSRKVHDFSAMFK